MTSTLTQQQRDQLASTLKRRSKVHQQLQQKDFDHIVKLTTTADRIRYLSSVGYSVGEIADYLSIKYQHAFNTVRKELKKQ